MSDTTELFSQNNPRHNVWSEVLLTMPPSLEYLNQGFKDLKSEIPSSREFCDVSTARPEYNIWIREALLLETCHSQDSINALMNSLGKPCAPIPAKSGCGTTLAAILHFKAMKGWFLWRASFHKRGIKWKHLKARDLEGAFKWFLFTFGIWQTIASLQHVLSRQCDCGGL